MRSLNFLVMLWKIESQNAHLFVDEVREPFAVDRLGLLRKKYPPEKRWISIAQLRRGNKNACESIEHPSNLSLGTETARQIKQLI